MLASFYGYIVLQIIDPILKKEVMFLNITEKRQYDLSIKLPFLQIYKITRCLHFYSVFSHLVSNGGFFGKVSFSVRNQFDIFAGFAINSYRFLGIGIEGDVFQRDVFAIVNFKNGAVCNV